MSFTKPIIFSALVGLAACAGTAPTTPTPLTNEAAFRSAVVGKTVGFEGSTFVINADNTVSGPWDGSGISGSWSWEDQYWCHDIDIGGVARGPDCQAWVIDGATAIVTRNRGTGNSFTYTIN